ncbi:MAG: hypothetical protein ACLFUB_16270 [Cyclobacteriaceae bacterium]
MLQDIEKKELKKINGGSEFSEALFRVAGAIAGSAYELFIRDADEINPDWYREMP